MYLKNSFILILFIILSCQPVEILKPIEIDTSNLIKFQFMQKILKLIKNIILFFLKIILKIKYKNHQIDLMVEWNNKNILKNWK